MPKNYRSFQAEFKIRSGKKPTIVGRIPYDSESEDMGFVEVLKPGCFKNALKSNPKILSLWNHDSSKPLANTENGSMTLLDTPSALRVKIEPDPEISWASDAIKAIGRGDIGGLSFGFEIAPGGAGFKNGVKEIREVEKLYEISPVAFPAYPESTVALRNKRKRGRKMPEYTKDEIRRILKDMEYAEGTDLMALGDEYDRIAPVVIPDGPLFAEVGKRGLQSYLSQSVGLKERTNIDTSNETGSRPFKNLGDQLRSIMFAGHPDGQTDPRLFQVRAASGLNEGTPSEGGFLLQQDFSTELLANVWNNNDILKRVRKYPLGNNTNSIKIPGFDETSRVDGSRFGGVRSYWKSEAAEFTATKPTFRIIQLELNKLTGLCYATDELLEDSSALEKYIKLAFTAELEFKIQDAIINGSGVGQPLGILNGGGKVEVAAEGGQTAATIVYENVLAMWSRLLAPSRRTAVWLINQDCEPQLNQMSVSLGVAGQPVYMPPSGISGQPYSTIFGRPVIPIEQCQTLGTTGDIMLVSFEDGYVAIDRAAKTDVSMHVRFIYDEMTFRFVYRFDGQPVLAAPVTPFKGTNTQAHVITLATR